MLKSIDPRITPELMDCLIRLGHGDEIVIADGNFPAASTAAHCVMKDVIRLPGFSATEAVELVTTLMPIDPSSRIRRASGWRSTAHPADWTRSMPKSSPPSRRSRPRGRI